MIRLLDKHVYEKIAAGEVVDRPVSIVKELVENSIDAGATTITCAINKGGKSYIRVTDNGCGIGIDQVGLAFLRHATSKICDVEDLNSIETLGFRGEALSSISAVARVSMITKTANAKSGKKMCVEGGTVITDQIIGSDDGTTVIVEDLFYNVPARLKFMKSERTEAGLISDLLNQIALAYPHIAVRFVNNDNIVFSTQGKGDRLKAIGTVFGPTGIDKLIFIEGSSGDDISISGYISGPGESRNSKKGQIFFVNGRVIKSGLIERSIREGYTERLFEGRYPTCYLFLDVAPEYLDVNIHPNKREIRFYQGDKIEDMIIHALRDGLSRKKAIPDMALKQVSNLKKNDEDFFLKRKSQEKSDMIHEGVESIDIKKILSTIRQEVDEDKNEVQMEHEPAVVDYDTSVDEKKMERFLDFGELHVLGTVFATYIVASDDTDLYLIDQHAAHERVFFEKLMDGYEKERNNMQELMVPIVISVTFSGKGWIESLEKMGFRIEDFGPNTYAVKSIPTIFDLKSAEIFINDYVDQSDGSMDFRSRSEIDSLAGRACKKAIKGNTNMDKVEIKSLLAQLSSCRNPYSCPHGRPTFVKMNRHDIEKRFLRV